MKIITILLSILFVSAAQAEVPSYVCGYGDVSKVATYDEAGSDPKMLPLLMAEKKYLKNEIDNNWDCDEGVELIGAEEMIVKGSKEIVLSAICSKDSLGANKVKLVLSCQEAYLD